MGTLWEYILSATIYGSITGIIILIIKSLMKNKINKKYAYLLWMILIIKLVFPFGPESKLSLFNTIPVQINNQVDTSNNNTSSLSQSTNYTVDTDYESNYSEKLPEVNTNTTSSLSTTNKLQTNYLISIIPTIWLSGVVMALIAHIIIYLHFFKNLRKKENIKYDYLENILMKCKEKLHIKRKISIVVDDMINSPSLVGIFKTRIIIPINLINLSEEELEHIFLHELCHFKSKDAWIDSILILLQCVHWFNPLVWYLFKHVRNDMEMACDERVLSVLEDNEHNKYGITMLTVLEKVNFNKRFSVGLNMADDKKTIKKRVELIKNSKHFSKKKKIFTITGISCLIVMGGVLLTNGNSIDKGDTTVSLPIEKNKKEDLDGCISDVIIEKYAKQNLSFLGGEFITESHVILGQDEDDDYMEVYLITTYGTYGFENDVFSMLGGTSNIPMRIKFKKNKNISGYDYVDSEEAKDGSEYMKSVKEMFPSKEADKALNLDYTDELNKDIYKKAVLYVKNMGRNNEVAYDYLDKTYIDELALKDYFGMEEIQNYPQWIGSREVIEDNERYIYKTEYNYSSKVITFTKYNEDKEKIETMQYKINGDEIEKMNDENFVLYSKDTLPIFIDNEVFKITVNNISIINNNAEYDLTIENKTENSLEMKMDKIHIGDLVKKVDFKSNLNSSSSKHAKLKIENISKLEELSDKIYGSFLVNSKEYTFIFK